MTSVIRRLGVTGDVQIPHDRAGIELDLCHVHAASDGIQAARAAAGEDFDGAVLQDIVEADRVLVNGGLALQDHAGEGVGVERVVHGRRGFLIFVAHIDRAAVFRHVQSRGVVLRVHDRAHVRDEVGHGAARDIDHIAEFIRGRNGALHLHIGAAEGCAAEIAVVHFDRDAAGNAA